MAVIFIRVNISCCFTGAWEVSCPNLIKSLSWNNNRRNFESCVPAIDEVDDRNFTISSEADPTIQVFGIQNKKGVKFLPTNLFRIFPDLIVIEVLNCSVALVENHFKGLSKLKYLNLGHNKINHIASDAFIDLTSLEVLGLSYNRIRFLAENIFSTLQVLETLHLSNNKIQVLHPNIFGSIAKVELLNLEQNKIFALPENIFENTTSLKKLSFYANKLVTIPNNLLKNNLKLETIWLNVNNIEFIDANMFNHLPSLEFVSLKGNVCVDKIYNKTDFSSMRADLKKNCSQNFIPGAISENGVNASSEIGGSLSLSSTGWFTI